MASVFVGIAAYNEPALAATCEELLRTAEHDVRIGVCAQGDMDTVGIEDHPAINVLRVSEPLGICAARHAAASLYIGEDYYFQTDAHLYDWRQGWDDVLIAQMARVGPRAVLSLWPPDDEIGDVRDKTLEYHPTGMWRDAKGTWLPVRSAVRDMPDGSDRESILVCGGSAFFPGEFLRGVGLDPRLHHSAEEAVLSLSLWTHGYGLYAMDRVLFRHVSRRRRPGSAVHASRASAEQDALARAYLGWQDQPDVALGAERSRDSFLALHGLAL